MLVFSPEGRRPVSWTREISECDNPHDGCDCPLSGSPPAGDDGGGHHLEGLPADGAAGCGGGLREQLVHGPSRFPSSVRNPPARGTTSLATSTCTTSPRWLRVSLRTTATPRSGRDREGLSSATSLSTRRTSPGRTGAGQV